MGIQVESGAGGFKRPWSDRKVSKEEQVSLDLIEEALASWGWIENIQQTTNHGVADRLGVDLILFLSRQAVDALGGLDTMCVQVKTGFCSARKFLNRAKNQKNGDDPYLENFVNMPLIILVTRDMNPEEIRGQLLIQLAAAARYANPTMFDGVDDYAAAVKLAEILGVDDYVLPNGPIRGGQGDLFAQLAEVLAGKYQPNGGKGRGNGRRKKRQKKRRRSG